MNTKKPKPIKKTTTEDKKLKSNKGKKYKKPFSLYGTDMEKLLSTILNEKTN